MTYKELKLIEARIKAELANMSSLLSELEKHGFMVTDGNGSKIQFDEDNSFMLRAIGSVLHDFYVAVENILEIIGREIDEYLPEGLDWHIQLLRQMALEVEGIRTAVISGNTLFLLDKYRSFRHVFRNVYGFSLDAAKLRTLLDDLANTSRQFSKEIETFLSDMRSLME
ncbi:MAG: hypothetical protein DDT21_01103 [Syntrophomonadaceae bacterium]|nr:hypothetical protein [Bacillota bacterium]